MTLPSPSAQAQPLRGAFMVNAGAHNMSCLCQDGLVTSSKGVRR